jgi:hypothetical protein
LNIADKEKGDSGRDPLFFGAPAAWRKESFPAVFEQLYNYFVKASLFLKLFKSGAWGDSPIKAPRRGWIAGVSPRYAVNQYNFKKY